MNHFLQTFRESANRVASRTAIEDDSGGLSYGALASASDALAAHLIDQDLPDDAVLAFFKTSMVGKFITALGCLKAGLPYLVVHPYEDAERQAHILRTAKVTHALVEHSDTAAAARALGCHVVTLDRAARAEFAPRDHLGDRLAWLEPTSGSTGKPKLVGVDRNTLQHYLDRQTRLSGITERDRIGNFGEMWLDTLLVGPATGAVTVHYDLRARGTGDLEAWMRRHEISAIQTYTAAFRALCRAISSPLPALGTVRLAGEMLTRSDVQAFEALCGKQACLTNYLGSTECSFVAQHVHHHGTPVEGDALPVGQIIDGTTVEIHDETGTPLPPTAIGAVVLKSRFMATGYYNNPEQTEGVFWQEPDGTRVLNTGDLGRLSADGTLTLVGRVDDQVKIRGYSVRYSEVESALSGLPGIEHAAVTSHLGPTGIRVLSAHYEGNADLDARALRAQMLDRVPSYMVPNYYTRHDRLPRTDTGKVLRRALPDPVQVHQSRAVPDRSNWREDHRFIAGIWRSYLGHDSFGLEDDFFDVGGDSLHAMEMLLEVEQLRCAHIGYENLILHGATISAIAEHANAPGASVVCLRQGSPVGPQIYVLPVENGEFSPWLQVTNALPDQISVFGVQIRDSTWQDGVPVISARDCGVYAAKSLLDHAQGAQVCVAGYSAGTHLALETARALDRMGHPPRGLIQLDPTLPKQEAYHRSWKLRRVLSALVKDRDIGKALNRAGHVWLNRSAAEPFIADEKLFYEYRMSQGRFAPMLMITALEENPGRAIKEHEWKTCVDPKAEVHRLQCNHQYLVRNDNAVATAGHIANWIDRL